MKASEEGWFEQAEVHLDLDRDTFIAYFKKEIAYRAAHAGIDFDPADIIESDIGDSVVVFLRRSRDAQFDDQGEFIDWCYKDLIWLEFSQPFLPKDAVLLDIPATRIVTLCPWLVFILLPDGTVRGEGWTERGFNHLRAVSDES